MDKAADEVIKMRRWGAVVNCFSTGVRNRCCVSVARQALSICNVSIGNHGGVVVAWWYW